MASPGKARPGVAAELRVLRKDAAELVCTVVHGGALKDRRGINLPFVKLDVRAMTDKDIADARFAIAQGVDFLAPAWRWRSSWRPGCRSGSSARRSATPSGDHRHQMLSSMRTTKSELSSTLT